MHNLISTGPYPPGTFPVGSEPELGHSEDACCDACADGRPDGCDAHDGLGFVSFSDAKLVVETASDVLDFGGTNRHEGADCCPTDYPRGPWPADYDPPHPYPINAGQDGAPPDYRATDAPWLGPSRLGFRRTKDDYCNCAPIQYNGRWWMLGEVRDGRVFTGPPQNIERGVFVEVDSNGDPISVPGFGDVEPSGAWQDGSAGPVDEGWSYPDGTMSPPSSSEPAPAPTPANGQTIAGVPPLAVLGILGAGVGLLIAQGGR